MPTCRVGHKPDPEGQAGKPRKRRYFRLSKKFAADGLWKAVSPLEKFCSQA
jgi:hypothetical protein